MLLGKEKSCSYLYNFNCLLKNLINLVEQMGYLTSDSSKNQFKSSKAAVSLRKTPESHKMFVYINNCTYKLSSILFKDSKTNEWTLSKEQDPKQFKAGIYLIFITQSLCSFLLTLGITRKKRGDYVRLTDTSCWISIWYFTFTNHIATLSYSKASMY